ncbi:MAG: condensation domain-containing protein, partial [Acidobacteriota bacterium]
MKRVHELIIEVLAEEENVSNCEQEIIDSTPLASYSLSANQKILWRQYQLEHNNEINVSLAISIYKKLDIARLQQAAVILAKRHTALRTIFVTEADKPIQCVLGSARIQLCEVDVSSWQQDRLNQLMIKAAHHPFDIKQGPPLRITLFKSAMAESVLLLTAPLIACDYQSLVILAVELCLLYQADGTDNGDQMASFASLSATQQYRDFVDWQNQILENRVDNNLWTYCQKNFPSEQQNLNLFTDWSRSTSQHSQT